ncbi:MULTISPECIES: hypothetical protein [Nocardiaceae]|uniref:DUF1109 domain-containing protein n=1 Tax=Rhodococcoides corynebacterioides TaxID=53972 RepID=A0ABS2KUD4_9NOCA|nr:MULTISPECIES: hypothetical protein [Rhodococcus]MBM7415553.1 hypothetical protein [Rhodococcus corynebacterioides]MBP1118015.1 hypothetical protein [Rhodococcus sp. PvP016]
MRYEWWSYPSPAELILDLGTVWLGILGLAVVGVVWAVRLWRYRLHRGKFAWGSVFAPLLVMGVAISFAVIDLPAVRDFDRAKDGMEDLAKSMLRDDTDTVAGVAVDGVSFSPVYVGKDDCVYFVNSDRNDTLSRAGWLYAGRCTPQPNTLRHLDALVGDWYSFEQES